MEKSALDTAKKMLSDGMTTEMIAKYTGLSPSMIAALKSN